MPVNFKAFERAMKKAVEAKKQAAALSTTPVAAKAPPVAPKKAEESLKSNLTEEEIQYYVNMIHEANERSPSHPNNPTNRLIRDRLNAMGLAPNDD